MSKLYELEKLTVKILTLVLPPRALCLTWWRWQAEAGCQLAPQPGAIEVRKTRVGPCRPRTSTSSYVLSDGTKDADAQAREVLPGKVFPKRANVIDTAELHALLEAGLR